MIIETLKDKKGFTANEIVIADYVLNNMSRVLDMTVEDLAQSTYTSKASVVRFCKKLRVNGYRDFLRKLESELNEVYRISALINKEPITQKSSLQDIINTIPSLYETAITQTKLLFDTKALQRIIIRLKTVEWIEIYGAGVNQTIARAAAFKFQSIGINAMAFDGLNEHYVLNQKKKKNKIAFLLTFTGYNPDIIKIAKYLKQSNYYIVGIGGNEHSILDTLCDEYIEIYTRELIMNFELVTTYTAMNYILDIFFASLLSAHYENNLKISLEVMKSKTYDSQF